MNLFERKRNGMTDLKTELATIRAQLDIRLNQALPLPNDLTARVIEAMRYSAIGGGKALRPFLILTTGRLLGVKEEDLWPIAVSLEMIHTYSLIHDDLPAMDNDSLRRGKPSNHIQFDEATAILAGDALLTKAFEILSAPDWQIDDGKKCRLISLLSHYAGTQGMIGGQMIDLIGEKQSLTLSELKQMQQLKTGALLEFSCMAPCVLALCDSVKETALRRYADCIGLLFQMTDDILDETGQEALVGKTLGKDRKAKKTTFISLFGLNKARETARQLEEEAVQSVAVFGENNLLSALAHYILIREK